MHINKIAEITLAFWIAKILATTLGETFGDYLSMTLNLGYYAGLAITLTAVIVLILFQIFTPRFHPVAFWAAIIGTTTAGTEISDFMDRSLGLGYIAGSIILVLSLFAALAVWYARHRDLAVYPMTGRDKELVFWIAVLISNSLGTAFGDFLVDNVGLSFLEGALVTSGIIGVVAILHYFTKLNDVLLFWIAFVFTRPFGATFGDLLTKPLEQNGLGLQRELASAVTFGLMLVVLYLQHRRSKSIFSDGS